MIGPAITAVALLAMLSSVVVWYTERSRRIRIERHFAPLGDALEAEARARQDAELATVEAARLLAEARRGADEIRAHATAEAEQVVAQAREEATVAVTVARAQAKQSMARAKAGRDELEQESASLRTQVAASESLLRQLQTEVDEIDVGLFKPQLSLDSSAAYREALDAAHVRVKQCLRDSKATAWQREWTVEGSKSKGRQLMKRVEKLALRAFNGEVEAAIAAVSWRNYRTMRARVEKAWESINRLSESYRLAITKEFRDLRLEELRLTFEEAERVESEREEQRRLRAQMREEQKAQRELEKAREDAEREEESLAAEVEQARAAAAKAEADGAEKRALELRLAEMEARLAEAHERKERAIAQAQLTRSGHVYVISNLGSFGEGVVKIGMTRRLEPQERIEELGDASVPFPFDVHALIYSEDAPGLEAELHNTFWDRRLNLANDRKEFFRVELEAVEAWVREKGLPVRFARRPEAKEFRLTQAELEAAAGRSPHREPAAAWESSPPPPIVDPRSDAGESPEDAMEALEELGIEDDDELPEVEGD